jgi:hypothetical protein
MMQSLRGCLSTDNTNIIFKKNMKYLLFVKIWPDKYKPAYTNIFIFQHPSALVYHLHENTFLDIFMQHYLQLLFSKLMSFNESTTKIGNTEVLLT